MYCFNLETLVVLLHGNIKSSPRRPPNGRLRVSTSKRKRKSAISSQATKIQIGYVLQARSQGGATGANAPPREEIKVR
jgi:hypothetical protein